LTRLERLMSAGGNAPPVLLRTNLKSY